MAATSAARHLWQRTGLTPADVDTAQLYDGFSILALAWIEALGFCGQGEGGAFIEEGKRIALDGQLPLNTAGGQLSFGQAGFVGKRDQGPANWHPVGGWRECGRAHDGLHPKR